MYEAFNVRRHGAAGDGITDDTEAIAQAVRTCANASGGTVFFPAGTYLTGPIDLASHMTLHLDAGATILGSRLEGDYPRVPTFAQSQTIELPMPLIGGTDLTHVAIRGEGIIDGQGSAWWDRFLRWGLQLQDFNGRGIENLNASERAEYKRVGHLFERGRPRLLEFCRCDRVLIEGVTLRNSPCLTCHPTCCTNVTIDDLTVQNPYEAPHADGITPESCRNVRISNCYVDVGDDGITLKSGLDEEGRRMGLPCEQVVISNCVVGRGHGGVVIGSETSGGVRDVAVTNCVFSGTDMGIRLKTARGRGGVVENVHFSHIVMNDVDTPIHVQMHYDGSGRTMPPEPVSARTPIFRDISMAHIHARGAESAGLCFGLAEMPIERLSLTHARIRSKKGFVLNHVRDVSFEDVHIHAEEGAPIVCKHVTGRTAPDESQGEDDTARRLPPERPLPEA